MRICALLLLVPLAACATHVVPDANDEPRRSFLEERGPAPPEARQRALAQMNAWLAAHEEATSTATWQSIGPQPIHNPLLDITGRVTAVVVSPLDPNIVVAGTSGGGIWRSTNGGGSFVPITDDQADITVGTIAFAPSNPRVFYAGMGDDHLGTGILKSTDSGATWHRLTSDALGARNEITRIAVDPHDENVLWVAQRGLLDASGKLSPQLALLTSSDGGATWRSSFTGFLDDVVFASDADSSTLIIGASRQSRPGTGGLYRTTDGGATWTNVFPQGDPDVPPYYFLARFGATLYASVFDSVDGQTRHDVMASTDGGLTWTKRGSPPFDQAPRYLSANPVTGTLFFGGVGFYRSTDGGATWTTAANATYVDQHAVAYDASNPSRVWFGNDGGLWRSDDDGRSFHTLADKLVATELYAVAAHPTDPGILFGGAQDSGVLRRSANNEWVVTISGDGGYPIFDAATSRMMVNLTQGTISRCSNNGLGGCEFVATTAKFGDPVTRIAYTAPLVRGRDGTVYFGTYRVFASKDFGTTWAPPAGTTDLTAVTDANGRPDLLTAIAAADSDPATLYTGSRGGAVNVSRDSGVTWTEVTPARSVPITSIAIGRTSAATAYVGYSTYTAARVMKTTDAGATWSDASNGLPKLPVDALYVDTRDDRVVYAGTDIGVFRSTDAGATWTPFHQGMPPVIVTSFTTTANGILIAGTYGRGAYELVERADGRRRAVRH